MASRVLGAPWFSTEGRNIMKTFIAAAVAAFALVASTFTASPASANGYYYGARNSAVIVQSGGHNRAYISQRGGYYGGPHYRGHYWGHRHYYGPRFFRGRW